MKRDLSPHKRITLILAIGLLFLPSQIFAQKVNKISQQKRSSIPKRVFSPHNFNFVDAPLDTIIRAIADMEQINIIFEDAVAKLVETKKVSFKANNISVPRALETLFDAQRLGYAPVDKR